jgi:DNA polymerase-3 subunit epsilon
VEINGEVVEEFTSRIQPFKPENIDEQALKVNGVTRADLEKYPHPKIVYDKLIDILAKYVNKYEKSDKFTPIGYNVKFDCEFLSAFFKKNDDKYYGSWFNWKTVDPLALLHMMDYKCRIALPNYKLTTACQHFGIPLVAHDALNDIRATRELWYLLDDMPL